MFVKRPAPFVLVVTDQGTMIVNSNDHSKASNGTSYGVGYQLLTSSCFDPEDSILFAALLPIRKAMFGDGVVFFDGGANIGVHTVETAKMLSGWGRVIAVEAQDRLYYALAGNIALNNCLNADAIYAALGDSVGTLSIPVPDYCQPASFGSLELKLRPGTEYIGQKISYEKENCKTVRLITIDSLELARLDFLKLDVEGMELEVLAGAKQTLEKCKPYLFIEHLKIGRDALQTCLRASGYKCATLGINTLAVHSEDISLWTAQEKLAPAKILFQ